MNDSRSIPEIVENFKNFSPRCNVVKDVRRLLESVPPENLRGIRSVVLTNYKALPRREQRRKPWSRGRKLEMKHVRGMYHPIWKSNPPWIEIFVDRIEGYWPAFVRWLPIMRELLLGEVLYHEIGHHIHFTKRPEHREKEDVAEDWQKELMDTHLRKRLPFYPALYLLRPILSKVADFLEKWLNWSLERSARARREGKL